MQEVRVATSLIHAVSSPEVGGELIRVVVAGVAEGGPGVGDLGSEGKVQVGGQADQL
jgi:hypothetical protein